MSARSRPYGSDVGHHLVGLTQPLTPTEGRGNLRWLRGDIAAGSCAAPDNPLPAALGEGLLRLRRTRVRIPPPPRALTRERQGRWRCTDASQDTAGQEEPRVLVLESVLRAAIGDRGTIRETRSLTWSVSTEMPGKTASPSRDLVARAAVLHGRWVLSLGPTAGQLFHLAINRYSQRARDIDEPCDQTNPRTSAKASSTDLKSMEANRPSDLRTKRCSRTRRRPARTTDGSGSPAARHSATTTSPNSGRPIRARLLVTIATITSGPTLYAAVETTQAGRRFAPTRSE